MSDYSLAIRTDTGFSQTSSFHEDIVAMCSGAASVSVPMTRIEAVWLTTAPLDMRCGTDTALARVVKVFGEARVHHAYPFANARASLRAGQRAAVITSLIQSAKLNGHDPYAYFKDVLTRLPTHKQRDIDQLLPHRWQPSSKAT